MTTLDAFVFILTLMPVVVTGQNCKNETVDSCTKPLERFNLHNMSSIVPIFTEDKMREICRAFDKVEGCLRRIRSHCHRVDEHWFLGIERSYHYVCDETFDEYLKYRSCLAKPSLHREGKQCQSGLNSSLESPSYLLGSVRYKRKRICQYVFTYLDCVYNLVESFCGKTVAKWQRKLDERGLAPILTLVDCHLPNQKNTEMLIMIIAIVIAVLAVLLCLVIALIVHFRKKRARDGREDRGAHARSNGTANGTARAAPPSVIYQAGPEGATALPALPPHGPPEGYLEKVEFDPPAYREKEDPPPSYRGPGTSNHDNAVGSASGGVSYLDLPGKDQGPPDYHEPQPPNHYDDIGQREPDRQKDRQKDRHRTKRSSRR